MGNTNELITILFDELGITVTYCLYLKVNSGFRENIGSRNSRYEEA